MSRDGAGEAPLVAVTGAAGFIGGHLCRRFAREGWRVRALVRDPTARVPDERGVALHRCDLPDRLEPGALAGARAVVHCAWATREADPARARPIDELGSRRVLEASRAANVARFVFVSSQSAHDGATSCYGTSKLRVERMLDPGRDLIIRPGLVLGRGSAGLFGRMCDWVRRGRVVPLFGGGRQPLQTVLIDDLVEAILAGVTGGHAGRYTVAEPEPIAYADFLRLLAAHLDARPWFVPFPLRPTLAALRTAEALGLHLPVSSENLRGLQQMREDATAGDLARLGVAVRPAAESLAILWPRPAPRGRRGRGQVLA